MSLRVDCPPNPQGHRSRWLQQVRFISCVEQKERETFSLSRRRVKVVDPLIPIVLPHPLGIETEDRLLIFDSLGELCLSVREGHQLFEIAVGLV